ncbi:uncharacterized protein LOC115890448 [Sitophilus oryzae]|uniref:Uncharacterized protein LOC115890448 n=1 Tax=Sitophilus oryzae TaxID=7048 RepID=A0A6J2YTM3_SITOR|nr:uncharacterized protein LOC115890448 [Sitophilus oryzae]
MSLPLEHKLRVMLIRNLRERGNYLLDSMNTCTTTELFDPNEYLACQYSLYCEDSVVDQSLPISEQLKTDIFPKMRPDLCSKVTKEDTLICKYGSWYLENISSGLQKISTLRMRELAKLLMEIQERNSNIKDLEDALQLKYFNFIVDSIKYLVNSSKILYDSIKKCCELISPDLTGHRKREVEKIKEYLKLNFLVIELVLINLLNLMALLC